MNPLKSISFPKLAILSLALLGLLIYANSVVNPFIWDDFELVTRNASVQSWSGFPQLFTGNVVTESSFYRPIQMVTYLFDHEIWGLNPKGFHFTSILIHIFVSLALCWVVFLLTKSKRVSFLTAILFLVHPIHNEAVAYISGRADPLCALFILLTFAFYLKNQHQKNITNIILTSLCFVLAILSKEYALILPLLILGYHFSFRKKIDGVVWGVLSVLAVGFALLRLQGIFGTVDMHTRTHTTLLERLPATFEAMIQYIRLLCAPHNLTMGYGQKVASFASPIVLAGLALYIGLMGTAFRIRKRSALLSFALVWYIIGLFPVMNLYPVNAYMAEHWLYVPSIGFFLILAVVLEKLYQQPSYQKVVMGCCVFIIGAFSFLTIQQNQVWHNPFNFYQRVVEINPKFIKAYNNLGKMNAEAGNCMEAITYFEKALEVEPNFVKAYNNAAVCYADLGQKDKAIDYYQKALNLEPEFVPTYNNLGVLFMENDNLQEARKYFDKALDLNPKEDKTYFNLGILAEMKNNYQEAIGYYTKALEINPSYREAQNNIGSALSRRSEKDKAIQYYLSLIDQDPENEVSYNNLGVLYMHQGRFDEAVDQFAKALSKKTDYAEAHYNIGTVFYRKNSLGQAMRHLQDALSSDSEHVGAMTNLGIVYAMQGKLEQSEQMFKQALYLNPDDVPIYNNLGLILARQGRIDEAIENYRTAINKNSEHKESHSNLALAYEQKNDLESAKEYYEEALKLDPKFVSALNGLGVIYGKLEDYPTAEKLFQQVLEIQPNHRDARVNLQRAQSFLTQKVE